MTVVLGAIAIAVAIAVAIALAVAELRPGANGLAGSVGDARPQQLWSTDDTGRATPAGHTQSEPDEEVCDLLAALAISDPIVAWASQHPQTATLAVQHLEAAEGLSGHHGLRAMPGGAEAGDRLVGVAQQLVRAFDASMQPSGPGETERQIDEAAMAELIMARAHPAVVEPLTELERRCATG